MKYVCNTFICKTATDIVHEHTYLLCTGYAEEQNIQCYTWSHKYDQETHLGESQEETLCLPQTTEASIKSSASCIQLASKEVF